MGHESQIEPWLAHDQRSACWFHKSLASSQIEYENHRGRTHKRYAVVRSVPSLWSGMREQSCSIPRGLKVNKNSAEGEVFFVDFPSYRTFQAFRKRRSFPPTLRVVSDIPELRCACYIVYYLVSILHRYYI